MAVTKEELERLRNFLLISDNTGSLEGMTRLASDLAKELEILINSTDVAEVEKLRARVLELEAEREAFQKDLEITSKARDEAVAKVEGLLAVRYQPTSEMGEPSLWVMMKTPESGGMRIFNDKPFVDSLRGAWMSENGSVAIPGMKLTIPVGEVFPLYLGSALPKQP